MLAKTFRHPYNACISKKKLFQTNRIYLIPAFYPSFTPVILPPEYLLPSTCHLIKELVEMA